MIYVKLYKNEILQTTTYYLESIVSSLSVKKLQNIQNQICFSAIMIQFQKSSIIIDNNNNNNVNNDNSKIKAMTMTMNI